jgi:6-pyruvoyltetrahydropterin/6-carboxytetrahydropterin synthase
MTITKRLEIDAGHRLMKHEGKCRNVHGHRYAFDITCSADKLDEVGRVIDFSVVKAVVGGWLDEKLDHGFIAQAGDPIIEWLKLNDQKLHVVDFSPTAENLSAYVLEVAQRLLLPHGVQVRHIRCWETPSSFSTVTNGA